MAMEMNNLPTANPLASPPVYVALVPGMQAGEGSIFAVVSGYSDLECEEAAEIHRLSSQVLQLAMVNCVVAVGLRIIAAGIAIAQGSRGGVLQHVIFCLFSFWVMYLGVEGVKKRNPVLCECCRCGHLTGFYVVYIVFSVLSAIFCLICIVVGLYGYFILNLLFLTLYGVTADKARRLLDALERSGTDASLPRPMARSLAPGSTGHQQIPTAAATEIGAMPVAMAHPVDLEAPRTDAQIKADANGTDSAIKGFATAPTDTL